MIAHLIKNAISISDDVIESRKLSYLQHLMLHSHLSKTHYILNITIERSRVPWRKYCGLLSFLRASFIKTLFISQILMNVR